MNALVVCPKFLRLKEPTHQLMSGGDNSTSNNTSTGVHTTGASSDGEVDRLHEEVAALEAEIIQYKKDLAKANGGGGGGGENGGGYSGAAVAAEG